MIRRSESFQFYFTGSCRTVICIRKLILLPRIPPDNMRAFLILTSVSAQMYQNELRHLPEKLRQERIHLVVSSTVKSIQDSVIQSASANHTDFQFSLFCIEPNIAQSTYGRLYQPYGDKYVLSPPNAMSHLDFPILPRPRCETKYGYELYRVWEEYSRYFRINAPNDGKTLYRVHPFPIQSPEVNPTIYIQRFFELFNHAFPDIRLEVSSHRPSQGIFESECCPIYNVSW